MTRTRVGKAKTMNRPSIALPVLLLLAICAGAVLQAQVPPPPGPPGGDPNAPNWDISPADYFNIIRIVTPEGTSTVHDKEYTRLEGLKESDALLCTLTAPASLTFDVQGAHSCSGHKWDKLRIDVGSASLDLQLITRIDANRMYPQMIDEFQETFPVQDLPAGDYALRICGRKLGRILVK